MSATYNLVVTSGNYSIVNVETGSGYSGACANLACHVELYTTKIRLTDRAWRNWMPILDAEASNIAVTDSSAGYDGDILSFSALTEYLTTVIVSASGGGGGGDSIEWGDITGPISRQTDLQEVLAGKASTSHTHSQSDVTGLSDALAGKASTSHTHAQSDVTGLSDALAGKASTSHTHSQSDVTGLSEALAGKASSSHTHAQSDVTGLSDALAGKANTSHTHWQSEIDGLVKKSRNVQYVSGKYFSLSKNVGETINLNSPASNSSGYCLVIPITGDFQKVVLHSYNSSASTRPWAITDSSGKILALYDWGSSSAQAMVCTITKADLPLTAAYIVCDSWAKNTYTDGHYAEIHEGVSSRVDKINPLFGKKVVVFGDSIVEGVDNRINGDYTSFADYLADYGCEVYKMGVGGTHLTPATLSAQASFSGYSVYHLIHAWCSQTYTVMDETTDYIANSTQYGDRWAHVPAFIKSTSPTGFDVVVICAGTNDWNNVGRLLGNWSDTSIPYNYTATVKAIVNELRAVNPSLQIVFVTPPVRWVDYDASNPDATKFSDNSANATSGLWLPDVAGTIIQTALRAKAIAVDMYKGMGVNEVNFSAFFTSGGTHPNDSGQRRMAKVIVENIGTNLCGGVTTDHVHTNKSVLDSITATAWAAKVGSTTLSGIEAITEDAYGNLSVPDNGTIYFTY